MSFYRRLLLPILSSPLRRGVGSRTGKYLLLIVLFSLSFLTFLLRDSRKFIDKKSLSDPYSNNEKSLPNINFIHKKEYNPTYNNVSPQLINKEPLRENIRNDFPLATKSSAASLDNSKRVNGKFEDDETAETNMKIKDTGKKYFKKNKSKIRKENEDIITESEEEFDINEEFQPPSPLKKQLQNIIPSVLSSIRMLQGGEKDESVGKTLLNIANKFSPIVLRSLGSQDNEIPALNLLVNALPLVLGKGNEDTADDEDGESNKSDGMNTIFSLAKLLFSDGKKNSTPQNRNTKNGDREKFENGETRFEKSRLPLSINDESGKGPTGEEKDEKRLESKIKNIQTGNTNSASKKRIQNDAPKSDIFNLALNSIVGIAKESSSDGSSVWDWFKELSNVGDFIPQELKEPETVPSWIQDALKAPDRSKSEEDIRNIYAILSRSDRYRVRPPCDKVVPFGGSANKDKDIFQGVQLVCYDTDFELTFDPRCKVYSFGMNNDLSFEDSMAQNGCDVFAFDTKMEKPSNLSSKIHFYNAGLGTSNITKTVDNEEIHFYTLPSILKHFKHKNMMISFLKINIDGDEWPILEQMVKENSLVANNFMQLGVTTHLHAALTNRELYGRYLEILEQLPALGFQLFASQGIHDNPEDIYVEPLLNNKVVSLTNYLSYIRI